MLDRANGGVNTGQPHYSAHTAVTHVVGGLRVDVRHKPFNAEHLVTFIFKLNDVIPDSLILLLMSPNCTMRPLGVRRS